MNHISNSTYVDICVPTSGIDLRLFARWRGKQATPYVTIAISSRVIIQTSQLIQT